MLRMALSTFPGIVGGASLRGGSTSVYRHLQCTTLCTAEFSMAGRVKVGAAQMTSTDDLNVNFQTCSRLVQEAAAGGVKFLSLPENFSFFGSKSVESLSIADTLDGPIMQRYCSLARFDVDVPGGPVLKESNITTPGSQLVVADSPVGRLGITVCYDLRFPELYQQLRFQHNAQVLLVPSAFTKVTGQAHWEILLRARAIETQCYVIAAAQAGKHNEKRESYGDAIIIDPWGTVVARCSDRLSTGIAVAEIDPAFLDSVRMRMPISEHRRPDIYGKSSSSTTPETISFL